MKPDTSQWHNPAAYSFVKDVSADIIAWEFLRRNPAYQRDFTEFTTTEASVDELRKRWGLQFRRQARPIRA